MKYTAAFLALTVIALRSAPAAAQTAPDQATDVVPSDTSRLFIGPTGRMLAPGQGYVAFDGLFMATVQVGVTRHFSMGAGMPIWWMSGAPTFWITPKVQLYNGERTSVAAGFMNIFVPGSAQAGLAYTVSTVGTLDSSMTVGGGVLYARGSDPHGGSGFAPVMVFGGERRFKPRVSFLTENYLGAHGGLVSAGARWRLQEWQVNLAGVMAFGGDWAFPGVLFSFAYKFGGR